MPEIDAALVPSRFLPSRGSGPIGMVANEHAAPPPVDDIVKREGLATIRSDLDTETDEFVISKDRRATTFGLSASDEPLCEMKSHSHFPSCSQSVRRQTATT